MMMTKSCRHLTQQSQVLNEAGSELIVVFGTLVLSEPKRTTLYPH